MEHVLDLLSTSSSNPALIAAAGVVIAAVITGLFKLAAAFISRSNADRRLKIKRDRLRDELKQICPHIQINNRDDVVLIESLCDSVGPNPWVTCRVCGKRFTQEEGRGLVDHERTRLEQWVATSLEEAGRGQLEALRRAVGLRERMDDLDHE